MNEAFNQSQRFVELWTEMATKMAAAGMAVSPESSPPQAAREARAAIFQTMSKHAEEAMRSPQFLEMMKQSLDGSLQFREQLNDFLTRLRHELQGVARQDIDSVLAGIHQLERRVLDRLCSLHALHRLEPERGWFQEHGRLKPQRSKAVLAAVNALCAEVRHDAELLVEAFGIPDLALADAAPVAAGEREARLERLRSAEPQPA